MPYGIHCHCPNNGAIVDLGIHAETLDDVQFHALILKNCPACQSDHEIAKDDLFIDREVSA
jgi:hypothetical protein